MGIVKALAVFILTSLIVFAVTIYLPKYHEVNRDQLQSLVTQLSNDYKEGQEDTHHIDNVLDTIPVKVALLYKGKVISSNIGKNDRVSAGENSRQSLTKNVPAGDLVLYYKEDDPTYQSLGLIIPLFAGLVCSGFFFFMNRLVENTLGSSQTMREDIERLQTINEMFQQKEDEFSRKIDKQIPDNPEEAHKLLKSMFKEKEVMLAELDKFNEKEEDFRKDISNSKMQLHKQKEVNNGLENKIRELQVQLSAAAKQEKQIEELKEKIEKSAVDLKEYKVKLRTYEKTDIDAIKTENANLKSKVTESETLIKASKDEIKELKKLDGEKLQASLDAEKQEKEELKKELKETKVQLKEAMTGLEGSDAGQLKIDNIEYQKTIKNLQKELNDIRENVPGSGQGEAPVNGNNILSQLKEKETEIENLRIELKITREMADSLKGGVNPDVVASIEDKQLVSTLIAKVQRLQEELNNKGSDSYSSVELEEQLKEKEQQIIDLRKQIVNRELEVKRLKSDGGGTVPDFNLEEFEADLQKSKSLALKYKKERDEKIKGIDNLTAAFELANDALRRKEEELAGIDDKYKIKIDELNTIVNKQTEELTRLKGTSDAQLSG